MKISGRIHFCLGGMGALSRYRRPFAAEPRFRSAGALLPGPAKISPPGKRFVHDRLGQHGQFAANSGLERRRNGRRYFGRNGSFCRTACRDCRPRWKEGSGQGLPQRRGGTEAFDQRQDVECQAEILFPSDSRRHKLCYLKGVLCLCGSGPEARIFKEQPCEFPGSASGVAAEYRSGEAQPSVSLERRRLLSPLPLGEG